MSCWLRSPAIKPIQKTRCRHLLRIKARRTSRRTASRSPQCVCIEVARVPQGVRRRPIPTRGIWTSICGTSHSSMLRMAKFRGLFPGRESPLTSFRPMARGSHTPFRNGLKNLDHSRRCLTLPMNLAADMKKDERRLQGLSLPKNLNLQNFGKRGKRRRVE